MNRITCALILALVVSGCNVDAHAPAASAAEPAAYSASFYWSELGTYTVYDGNVEMYD